MRPRLALVVALLALAPARPAVAGVRPRCGGELLVALPTAPAELDPARAATRADRVAARALHATLLETAESGALRPGLLEAIPEAEQGGKVFRLRLRPGLKFHNGLPVTARDAAFSLARLLEPATRSPYAFLALPIEGADAYRSGGANAVSGLRVVNDLELEITLAFPDPAFPRVLASLPTAVLPRAQSAKPVGAGPFAWVARVDGGVKLAAFEGHFRGRAFADEARLVAMDGRRAARALERGEVDLVVRGDAPVSGALDAPALDLTFALVNAKRVGASAEDLRRALGGAVDRAELTRLFVRGPAVPLSGLLPPALSAGAGPTWAAPAQPPRPASGARFSLLIAAGEGPQRAVADRLQVKLFDRGVPVAVEAVSAADFEARLAAGDYDLALLDVPLASPDPSLALAQAAWALGDASAARAALSSLGLIGDPAARRLSVDSRASALALQLPVVPLFARGPRLAARPGVQDAAFLADGGIDLGGVWLFTPRK